MVQKMSEGTSSAVYNACDANKRGFVYVFQIAGFIEMVLRTGSVGQYPILSNLDAPQHLKDFLQEYSNKFTPSVVQYYESRSTPLNFELTIKSTEHAMVLHFGGQNPNMI